MMHRIEGIGHPMHDSDQLLRVMLQSVQDAVVSTDAAGHILVFNPAAERLSGWTEEEALGKPVEAVLDLRASGSDKPLVNPVYAAYSTGSPQISTASTLLIGRSGRRIAIHYGAHPIVDESGVVRGCVFVFRDVTEAENLAHRLAYQAQHDPLTGLPNRILLVDRLEQAARMADRQSDLIAVIFVNLDRINDAYAVSQLRDVFSPAVADELLRDTAYRLADALRESDTVCRLGGAEFVLMLPGLKTVDHIESLVHKLLGELARPFVLEEQTLTATCSIGISLYPQDAREGHTLMRLADSAMEQARRAGVNQYRFASSDSLTPASSAQSSAGER